MSTFKTMSLAVGVAMFAALGSARSLNAQIEIGTWVRQPTASMPRMTMTVEPCCHGGRRLIYRVIMNRTETLLTVESRFDGSEAPVLVAGQPSGQTMAITRLDDHHTSAILKVNGRVFGTSKATLSADGRRLTVINDFTSAAGGQAVGKTTEIWVRR